MPWTRSIPPRRSRAISPLSLVATGPSTATRSSTTHHPPTVERVLGAKMISTRLFQIAASTPGAAASEHATVPLRARAFTRAVLSRASPACRARTGAAMSYREAKSRGPHARRARRATPTPSAPSSSIRFPGQIQDGSGLGAGDFHPFTDASSTA